MIEALVVFFSMVAVDYAWAKYMMEAAAKRPHRAALWSAVIVALGAITVLAYTHNPALLGVAVVGAYAGTFIAVWREKRNAEKPRE